MRSSYMKKTGRCIGLLAGLALLSGCGQQGEAQSVPPVEDAGNSPEAAETGSLEQEGSGAALPQEKAEAAEAAYGAFLEGDISLFDDAQVDTWALDIWKDTILAVGELEYTYLDLDGDGAEELLVQWIEEPGNFNAVFHYENGSLFCWQFVCVEMTSGDYPLKDGAMVSQYDYNGTSSYTIFRYRSDGSREEVSTL